MKTKLADARTQNTNSIPTDRLSLQPGKSILILIASVALGLSTCGCNRKIEAKPAETTPPRDLVADCRALAPKDPYADEADTAESAYAACHEASALAPDDPELTYLLATTALQSDRLDEAMAGFKKAEQLGKCESFYFLGDNAWFVERDAETAEAYYQRGAECGDRRAANELFSQETFGASANPELLTALYNSDIEKLNHVRFVSASYLYGFYRELGEQYLGPDFDTCWKATHYRGGETLNALSAAEKGDAANIAESLAYEKALPYVYQILFPQQGEGALDERREALREAGRADVLRMVEASQCKALLPYKMLKGIEEFARTKKRLFEVVREARPNVHSLDDLANLVRQENLGEATEESVNR